VVNAGSTVVEHTRLIFAPVAGVNSNGNGFVVDGILKSGAAFGTSDTSDFEATTVLLAGSIDTFIRVFTFRGNSVFLNVFQGTCWPSTVASVISIAGGAVNKLLFGEIDSLVFEESPRLSNTGGAESPT